MLEKGKERNNVMESMKGKENTYVEVVRGKAELENDKEKREGKDCRKRRNARK